MFSDIVRLDVVDSTNIYAKDYAGKHPNKNFVICAKQQNCGRGRFGRRWVSPAGNLYTSLFVSVNDCVNKGDSGLSNRVLNRDISCNQWQLVYVASLAVQGVIGKKATIKWPNDILLCGKKVGGILLEKTSDGVVIGVGVNIVSCPSKVGNPEIIYPTTSLKDSDIDISVEKLLKQILQKFSYFYQLLQINGFVAIKEKWLEKCEHINKQIIFSYGAVASGSSDESKVKKIQGTFIGISDDGSLILRDDNGCEQLLSFGEILQQGIN